MRSPWHEAPRRRAGWFALIAAVLLAHLVLGARVAAGVIGWNAGGEPRRIDVQLVQALQPSAPPVAPPPPPPPPAPAPRGERAPRVARASSEPRPAASTPEEAASASHEALRAEALALAASAAAAEAASAPASAPAEPPAASSAFAAASEPLPGPPQPALDWPPSTRLTYTLTGLYHNGPLYGSGVVEWRREGTHYQVSFDLEVEPWFTLHSLSDGQIAEDGLRPRHYEEWRKRLFGSKVPRHIEFEGEDVVLNNGNRVPRLPQSQDPGSQFVQFVWLFTTQPRLLKAGNVLEIPLALPGNLRRWPYRVGEPEAIALPFGTLEATPVRPIGQRRQGDLPFEIWIAPTLQYLPVRIHLHLDDQNYADLTLDASPLQAARAPASAASAGFAAP